MQECIIAFLTRQEFIYLEQASEAQHEQWRRFVERHQRERITQGNPKFREDNYKQFTTNYAALSEKEKEQDRLIITVITDRILQRADIGHTSWVRT